jgi:hypothetical protein
MTKCLKSNMKPYLTSSHPLSPFCAITSSPITCNVKEQMPKTSVLLLFVGEPGIDDTSLSGYVANSISTKCVSSTLACRRAPWLRASIPDARQAVVSLLPDVKQWHKATVLQCRGAGNRTRASRSQTANTTTMLHPVVKYIFYAHKRYHYFLKSATKYLRPVYV